MRRVFYLGAEWAGRLLESTLNGYRQGRSSYATVTDTAVLFLAAVATGLAAWFACRRTT
jgi:hypothetical protein